MITTVLCYAATSGSSVADYGKPCRVDMGNVGQNITPDGLQGIYGSEMLLKDNLDALCAYLIAQQEEADARARFKPEDACVALHEFVKGL